MKIETNLCMNCMSETNGSCEHCGYEDDGIYLACYLEPKTFLADRYIVGRLLSYNGESALYSGFDTETSTRITIKEYMPDTLCSRKRGEESITVGNRNLPLFKTYLSEFVDLHTQLRDADGLTNIQTVLDVFFENNTAYVVFEYISGISLKSYLQNCGGSLTWEQVKELFPPLFTTLSMVHTLGIVHRGISPATILVTDKSVLKLIGFSITAARTAGSELDYEVFSGYAAPEQYSISKRHGTWTDVYGISAVLYRCLTGQHPPAANIRIKEDTLTRPVLINRNIPEVVSDAVFNGMILDQDRRTETISVFVDRLFEQPASHSFHETSSDTDETVVVAKSKNKKNPNLPTMITLAVVGIVLVVLLVATLWMALNPVEPQPDIPIEITPASTTVTSFETPLANTTTTVVTETTVVPEVKYIVPNLSNRSYEKILNDPKYSFLVLVPTYEFNDVFAKDVIISQDIDPMTEVGYKTTINVVVSKGAAKVPLPDYTDLVIAQYTEILSALNIKYETKEKSSHLPKGTVIKCNKEINQLVDVEKGETVLVYISNGKQTPPPPETQPQINEEVTSENERSD